MEKPVKFNYCTCYEFQGEHETAKRPREVLLVGRLKTGGFDPSPAMISEGNKSSP